jgi:hypothetical protein
MISKRDWNKIKKRVVPGDRKAVRMSRLPKSVKLVNSLRQVADLTEVDKPKRRHVPAVLKTDTAHPGPPVSYIAVEHRCGDDDAAD